MIYSEKNTNFDLDKKIRRDLKDFEMSQNKKVIFGSTIGSISRGIHNQNSDYDVRFLFLEGDLSFSNKSNWHNEKLIRHRVYDKSSLCNCIPLWDMNAFLNFINEPYIDRKISYKLFHNVIWTFYSPYAFDPFGIQQVVKDFLNTDVNRKYEFSYHLNEAYVYKEKFLLEHDFKSFIYALHHFLSSFYIYKFKALPSTDIHHLYQILNEKDKNMIEGINLKYKKNDVQLRNKEILKLLEILHYYSSQFPIESNDINFEIAKSNNFPQLQKTLSDIISSFSITKSYINNI